MWDDQKWYDPFHIKSAPFNQVLILTFPSFQAIYQNISLLMIQYEKKWTKTQA